MLPYLRIYGFNQPSMHRIIAAIVGFVTGGLRIITLPSDSEVGQATAWN